MLAQRRRRWPRITSALGQCIVFFGVSGAGMLTVTSIMQHPENNTIQSLNAVSMTGQRRILWVNIDTALVECHVFAYNRPGDRLVLGQRRR